jgi:peptidoglycan/LPS O-acetylase OafA/YrhL
MYFSIQACRAVAALLVVLFHLGRTISLEKYFGIPAFDRPFAFGDAGVFFFFVLSGFIISHAHSSDIGDAEQLPRYVRRRVARIYPVYWIIFLAVYALACFSTDARRGLPTDIPTIIKSLLLVPQDSAVVGGLGSPVIVVAWTLQYEMVFYSIFGAFIVHRALGALFTLAALVSAGICFHRACTFPALFLSNPLLLLFCQGVFVSWLCKQAFNIRWPRAIFSLGIMAFALLAAVDIVRGDSSQFAGRGLLYGAASSLIIFGLVKAEQRGLTLSRSNILVRLGDASYSLYLIHFPLISALCKLAIFAGMAGLLGASVSYFLILISCIIAALAFSAIIERPILRGLGKHRAARKVVAA